MSGRFFQTCSIQTGDSKMQISLHNRLGIHPEQLQHPRTQESENLATGIAFQISSRAAQRVDKRWCGCQNNNHQLSSASHHPTIKIKILTRLDQMRLVEIMSDQVRLVQIRGHQVRSGWIRKKLVIVIKIISTNYPVPIRFYKENTDSDQIRLVQIRLDWFRLG